MSFDYRPPRWWGPALLAAAVVVLALAMLLLGALVLGARHLLRAVLVFAVPRAPVHLADVVGPFL